MKIEGATNTVVRDSTLYGNAQGDTATENYDEINIRPRPDAITGKTYYSTGTQILGNLVTPEKARYAIHEENSNKTGPLGPATGTVIEGNVTGGTPTENDDILTGSGGLDTMAGGKGDDTYYVNKTGDVITENPGEGMDQVFASAKYELGANVEKLTLTGTANINGYGNELDNVLIGNSAANTLEGLDGADALFGAGGNDSLKGGAGNDSLDGGVGADTMVGSTGDDTYIVDNDGDVVTEKSDNGQGGYDRVFSSVSYEILDEVEELTLTGNANLNATGNSGANTLNGNAGNNTINGGAGADIMKGGLGDDTYYVDNTKDDVVELAGEGTDTIISSRAFSPESPLFANVENLLLLDPADPNDPLAKWAIEGAGNQLNNLIVGNSANNKLYGNGGKDTLRGGAGDDSLSGGAGNNTLDGGAGNDILDGSLGTADVGFYNGKRHNYTITGTLADRTVSGDSGLDTLKGIEILQFDDGQLVGDTWVPTPVPPPPPPPPVNTGNQAVTRNGTPRSEPLNGRDNIDDTIKGQGGRDTIKGRGGNDKLYGGDDNDNVYGESGDDRVYGDKGNDYVNGGSGNDRVYGGSGSDWVYGSTGDDTVNGNSGDDFVHGGSGKDRVYGSTGNDRVYGDSGNDWVYGDTGNDTVYGGTGDDVVNGGSGNDRLYGNAGSDAFVFNSKLGTASSDRNVNFDTIVGFNVASDSLLLDNAIFKKLGSGTPSSPTQLDAEFFTSSGKARERDDYLIYNKKTGVLSYDADGSGRGAAVEFAQLSKNLKLTYQDFFVMWQRLTSGAPAKSRGFFVSPRS